ncbi:MAG: porphobilinogen synthase [Kiritimatiellaeota bacterium]|nr:porphobilinogen synthase [Kiritimatiellota bacterium]
MEFPTVRMRRLRRTESVRRMVRETRLSVEDLIAPLFVCPGENVREPVASMPGVARMSQDVLARECEELFELGIPAVLLFGIPDSKDANASSALTDHGVIQEAVREIKKRTPELLVITDVCLCEYTSHGHCGIIKDGEVDNDATLLRLEEMALSHARAGADMVAPSDMMDGRVGAIRRALDENGLYQVGILAYSAKYASAFYGPFRDAADSAPQFGDRRAYQMDPPNRREALREVALDVAEGADIVMVKPALAYLDVIHEVRQAVDLPVAAYSVSGEYAMVLAAAEKGWIDGERVMMELLTGIRRAGADLILTYFARKVASRLRIQAGVE